MVRGLCRGYGFGYGKGYTIVVKYALDELLKGAELDELFNEKNELYPNFSMVPQKYT